MTMHDPVRLSAGSTVLVLAIALAPAPAFALRPVGESGDGDTSAVPAAGAAAPATATSPDHPPRAVKPGTSGDDFTPSERIKADSAVSFPVDI
jgi:hypothetical protein